MTNAIPDFQTAINNLVAAFTQLETAKYALIVAILIAVCSSLLGVTLVLKRYSFIGDGLSHVAFGAMTVATIIGFAGDTTENTYITLIITVLCAVLILRSGQNTKIKGDAAIAMISVASLAFGYLIINIAKQFGIYTGNTNGDVCSTLFGQATFLTVSLDQVIICAILSGLVILAFLFLYNKIFAVTFDESFANATGTNANLYNLVIAILIAVIIVLAMNLVGSLLISALVIFPALSAMRIFKSFKGVTIFSVALSVICSTLGLVLSAMYNTPAGSTIVAIDVIVFALYYIIGAFKGGKKV
ncbi:MAG: metal ABC transporter permease [Clostridia bacterium]|nr:metal ABC transporter permease [Clostridia bacterium]